MKAAPARALAAMLVASMVVSACSGTGGQASVGAVNVGGASSGGAGTTRTTVATKAAHGGSAPQVTPTTVAPGPATFVGPDGVEARWVIDENRKPGTTAWHLSGRAGPTINGFADLTAAREGQKVTLYVTTKAARYHISAYRTGYYGGKGGRLVWRSGELKGHVQPACTLASATNMVACDNWAPSVSLVIGQRFVQGDYLFKLVADPGAQSYVPLTVWGPSSHATYVVQNSVLTWQGWNTWGGYDMYWGVPPGGARPSTATAPWWSRSTGPMPTAAAPPISWPWNTPSSIGPKSTGSTSPTGQT